MCLINLKVFFTGVYASNKNKIQLSAKKSKTCSGPKVIYNLMAKISNGLISCMWHLHHNLTTTTTILFDLLKQKCCKNSSESGYWSACLDLESAENPLNVAVSCELEDGSFIFGFWDQNKTGFSFAFGKQKFKLVGALLRLHGLNLNEKVYFK